MKSIVVTGQDANPDFKRQQLNIAKHFCPTLSRFCKPNAISSYSLTNKQKIAMVTAGGHWRFLIYLHTDTLNKKKG